MTTPIRKPEHTAMDRHRRLRSHDSIPVDHAIALQDLAVIHTAYRRPLMTFRITIQPGSATWTSSAA